MNDKLYEEIKNKYSTSRWSLKEPMHMEEYKESKVAKHRNRYADLDSQLRDFGFCESELWNLDCTIAEFILPRLIKFKETTDGSPSGEAMKLDPDQNEVDEWNNILDKMILAFYHLAGDGPFLEEQEAVEVKEGLELFAKYFRALWD